MAAGVPFANLTRTADVETAITPITTAIYGLNGGIRMESLLWNHVSIQSNIFYHVMDKKSRSSGYQCGIYVMIK